MKLRRGTIVDGLTLLIVSMVILSLLLVKVQSRRTLARGEQCSNNMKQLGLAFHNYHSAYKLLPPASGGTDSGSQDEPLKGNANRLSAFVALTPFIEQQRLWMMIANPLEENGKRYPSMGPAPWISPEEYSPWGMRFSSLVCPSDPESVNHPIATNYVLNYGDAVLGVGAPESVPFGEYFTGRETKRGAFIRQRSLRFRDYLDGLSYTLFLSEAKISGPPVYRDVGGLESSPARCLSLDVNSGDSVWEQGRESAWMDGRIRSIGFQTILPPNSPSATSKLGEFEGVFSVSSHHGDGVHGLLADGSVRFVRDSVDAGNATSPSVGPRNGNRTLAVPGSKSPYGVWGGLGTRAAREKIQLDEDNFGSIHPDLNEGDKAEYRQFPIQTWQLSDGSTVDARLIPSLQGTRIQMMTDGDELRLMRLSDLSSQDAYRAVKQIREQVRDKTKLLLVGIETATKYLEQRDYQGFVSEAVVSAVPKDQVPELVAMLRLERGAFITKLDHARFSLETMGAQALKLEGNSAEIRSARSRLSLVFENGAWRIGDL